MQVNGTDKGSNRIKCGRLWGRRRADKAVRNMTQNQNAFNTQIDPSEREIGKVDAPILFAFVDVRLKHEPLDSVPFTKIIFVV
jgi:hypothetical protein